MKKRWLLVPLLLIACGGAFFIYQMVVPGASFVVFDMEWDLLKQKIRDKYPEVKFISTEELATWQSTSQMLPPILIDVRSEEEYATSHLPGALFGGNEAALQSALAPKSSQTPIVVYCSVGYRSGRLAQEIKAAGFENVFNLEGSIFAWANERRPLANAQGYVSKVHPYNAQWGQLLKPEFRQ